MEGKFTFDISPLYDKDGNEIKRRVSCEAVEFEKGTNVSVSIDCVGEIIRVSVKFK